MEVVIYANYIGLRRFYRYVVNIGRWSPYEGGQLDRFHCTTMAAMVLPSTVWLPLMYMPKKIMLFLFSQKQSLLRYCT